MSVPLFQVDAFADRPFRGNPAGVCLLETPADDAWMQAVAAEMNLAETAFLRKGEDGWLLRWFTPKVEVDLCGHATLASAHVLYETGRAMAGEPVRFHTLSGVLRAGLLGGAIEMDFPATPARPSPLPPGLPEALGLDPARVADTGRTPFDILVVADSDSAVRSLAPDFPALRRTDARGVCVTARSEAPEFDFISRFFAPDVGIDEDPVTGSAHCCLGPYWSKILGKTRLDAFQASSRGGTLEVETSGDRVFLRGKAVTVFSGTLLA